MESIIKHNLLHCLLKRKLISKQQHGFLAKHSTVTNLLESINDWTLFIKKSHCVNVAYIDFSKAFDSVCHSKLITKLRGYGIAGRLLNWIASYLTGRSQVVCVTSHISTSESVIVARNDRFRCWRRC